MHLFLLSFLLILVRGASSGSTQFTYDQNDMEVGPKVWGSKINPQCGFKSQSPININPRKVTYGARFKLDFEYGNAELFGTFGNNGSFGIFQHKICKPLRSCGECGWTCSHWNIYKGSNVMTGVSPIDLLPTERNFYTYSGSLTTPPCAEVVQWIVLDTPVSLSRKTFKLFRSLRSGRSAIGIFGNFRPIQKPNNRLVEANFRR